MIQPISSRPMSDPLPQYIDPIRLAARSEYLAGQLVLTKMVRLASMLASAQLTSTDKDTDKDKEPASTECASEHSSSMHEPQQGYVDIALEFGIDHSKIRNIRGRIQANVKLVCQRCLATMDYKIDSRVLLGIIKQREQADRLPSEYEPLLVESDDVSLQDIVEDEMILAIPNTPLHDLSIDKEVCDKEVCESVTENSSKDVDKDVDASQKHENPFSVLADLKIRN